MKVYEVVDSAGTNHAGNMSNDEMVQKARTVKAKIDKAEATGDADLLFSTGADLGELLMNNLYPKMLKFTETHEEIGVFIVFPDKKIYYNKTFTDLVNNLKIEENPSE